MSTPHKRSSNTSTDSKNDPSDSSPECSPEEINPLFFENAMHYRKESIFSQSDLKMNLDGFKNCLFVILGFCGFRLALENMEKYGLKGIPGTLLLSIYNDESTPTICFLLFMIYPFVFLSLLIERLYVFYLDSMGRCEVYPVPESMSTMNNILKVNNDDDNNNYSNNNPLDPVFKQMTMLRFKIHPKEEKIFNYLWFGLLLIFWSIPIIANLTIELNFYLSGTVCLIYCTVFMKMYSFHEVNRWWRTEQVYQGMLKPKKDLQEKLELYQGETLRAWNPTKLILYPKNLTIGNVLKYLYLPTLCYQCNYPTNRKRNYQFLLRCLLEFIFLTELLHVLCKQWLIYPLLQNHFDFRTINTMQFLLRFTKLSLGMIVIWLIFFYDLFQSFCNLSAEIFNLADRHFYDDWWNARSGAEFWRKWNQPVHRWCKRHVYRPYLLSGYSVLQANLILFFYSGVFHEYLVSVPLRRTSFHFFILMFTQVFLDMLASKIRSWHVANALLWFTMIVGLPALIVFYHNDVISS